MLHTVHVTAVKSFPLSVPCFHACTMRSFSLARQREKWVQNTSIPGPMAQGQVVRGGERQWTLLAGKYKWHCGGWKTQVPTPPASPAARHRHLTRFKLMRPRSLWKTSENAFVFLIKGHVWLAPPQPSSSLEYGHDAWSWGSHFVVTSLRESQRYQQAGTVLHP